MPSVESGNQTSVEETSKSAPRITQGQGQCVVCEVDSPGSLGSSQDESPIGCESNGAQRLGKRVGSGAEVALSQGEGQRVRRMVSGDEVAGTTPARKNRKDGISASTLMRMLKDQEFRCAISGRELTPDTVSLDHKRPVSRGGTNDIGNLQLVTKEVNAFKRVMTNEELLKLCRDIVVWNG